MSGLSLTLIGQYHAIALAVLGKCSRRIRHLSEFPALEKFLLSIDGSNDLVLPIRAVDSIGSAIPMLSDCEFLIVLPDLAIGSIEASVDPILCTAIVNRFIDVSKNGVHWTRLKSNLSKELASEMKHCLRSVARQGWFDKRAETRSESIEKAFM